MHGSAYDDALTGNIYNNALRGRQGDDTLDGGAGRDWLDGGAGNDLIAGGSGADQMFGGGGADSFLFDLGDGADRIGDFGADDAIVLDPALWGTAGTAADLLAQFASRDGDDILFDFGGGDSLRLSGYDDLAALEGQLF